MTLQRKLFLTDPFVQVPTKTTVNIVWFTEFSGKNHYVEYGENFSKRALCKQNKLSRMREDCADGHAWVFHPVYRQEAVLTELSPDQITQYRAVSVTSKEEVLKSAIFQCNPSPSKDTSLKILFTSDHQGKPMVAANLQKIKEVVPEIDAIFFAGDCVNHADKASEWFNETGFFSCLQGNAHKQLYSKVYQGAPLLQSAPIFCTIGNHDVMGQWNEHKSLYEQSNNPYPRKLAELRYKELFPGKTDLIEKEKWIKDHSFNSDSYEEIFSLPQSTMGGKKYYALTFGNIRLIVLQATCQWRKSSQERGIKSKYSEDSSSFDNPLDWGHGDFIFEPIQKGSDQYNWLEKELQSDDFQCAKYKIVMMHNPLYSLVDIDVPAFTDPVQEIKRDANGKITDISYHYPQDQDYLIRDLEPLFIEYGVDLVLCGHMHIWNRFQNFGVNYLETSNVGSSEDSYRDTLRNLVPEPDNNYPAYGNRNAMNPVFPSIAPLKNSHGNSLPYISSNSITVFSIFSTDTGAVDSYYFDTTKPDSEVVHFDRLYLSKKV